jgi:hypothetical protein
VPDELLRAVVGHADERMTERYFHPGLEAIKEHEFRPAAT